MYALPRTVLARSERAPAVDARPLARAIMAAATRSHRGPTPLPRYVHDGLAAANASVERAIHRPRPTVEDLHDLHRDLRRLRTILRIVAPLGRASGRRVLRGLDGRLRRLTQIVGDVRDLDVLLAIADHFPGASAGRGARPAPALSALRARLREDTGTGRELLRATLRAQWQAGLFDEARAALPPHHLTASERRISRVLSEQHRRMADAARRARKKSVRRPTPERLHDFRVWIRRWRYLTDLDDALRGARSPSFPRRLSRLQRRLGDLHDRDVLLGRLDELDPGHRSADWAAAFHRERDELRRELLRELRSVKLRSHPRLRALADRSDPRDRYSQ